MSLEERFYSKFEIDYEPDGCWNWLGVIGNHGYGVIRAAGKANLAHRIAHELLKGPIPQGMHIDHTCRNRRCVCPEHLEAVTLAENNRRSGEVKTHCPHGHEYTPDNTRVYRGMRFCIACSRSERRKQYMAEYHRRRKAGR